MKHNLKNEARKECKINRNIGEILYRWAKQFAYIRKIFFYQQRTAAGKGENTVIKGKNLRSI